MSYSALVLNDSPEAIWSLEEQSGTVVYPDAFIIDPNYNGSYNSGKFLISKVPIVYSGKSSICNNGAFTGSANYSADNKMFQIPSIGKFSSATKNKSYTLEFWMNLDLDESSLSSGASSRIGESQIVKISGSTTSGLYIRDLDYLVFKIGDNGYKTVESAINVESFKNPLHIMVVYTPFSIQIFVNGIPGTLGNINENIFGDEESRNIEFLFPNRISSSSSYFSNVSYDTVVIYSQALNSLIAKRHYIYGLGYSVPKYTIKSIGGVQYETNMQITTPLKQINYLNSETWSSRTSLENLQYTNDNLSTLKYNNQDLYISSTDSSIDKSDMITSDGIIFPQNSYSYLEINGYEGITGGSTKKIEAKFTLLSGHSTTKTQQLMFIGSKSISSKYVSCTILDRTISVFYNLGSSEETLMSYTLDSLADSFFISIAKDSSVVSVSIVDESDESLTDNFSDLSIFPLQDSYIRFGSSPVFFGNSVPQAFSLDEVKRFDGALNQVDLSNSTSTTQAWASYPVNKISSLYQLYSNSLTKKLCVATSGTFNLTLSLIDLIGLEYYDSTVANTYLAPKVEMGSAAAEITYDLKSIVSGVTTTIENDKNIRELKLPSGITSSVKSQELQYAISGTLRSSDIFTTPGILEYFRIYTYPVQVESSRNYIEINDTTAGPNAMYFSGYSSSTNHPFLYLPEIEKTSEMHRSFKTGVYVGTHGTVAPYLKIPSDSRTITTETTPKIYAVFFNGRHFSGTASDMELLRASTYTVNWSTPEPSGVELYINGERYSSGATYNRSLWNNYCIKFTSGIPYDSDIFFGYSGSGWTIDNVSVILDNISSSKINELYLKMFGRTAERFPDNQAAAYANILIRDSESSDGVFKYQPLSNQEAFLARSICPTVASTSNFAITNVSGSTWKFTYNRNRDLITIDGIELQVGSIVLLKDQITASQNGIYIVATKPTDGSEITLTKQSDLSNNTVVYVISGNQNKNYYFKKNGNSFIKTQTQKKMVHYDNAGHSVMVTVSNTT